MGPRLNDEKPSTVPYASEDVGANGGAPPSDAAVAGRLETLWGGSLSPDARPDATIKMTAPPSSAKSAPGVAVKRRDVAKGRSSATAPADYELLDTLGVGGMGIVYAARQTAVDRTIAVKMIKPDSAEDEGRREKFLAEAAVTGDLDHPNIIPIHDLGADDEGHLFYAMKRVKGTAWSKVIRQKTLPENLDILLRVADAVAFAHSRGVIHRDLKPENVMLGDFGEVLVMDWGLAAGIQGRPEDRRQESAGAPLSPAAANARLTAAAPPTAQPLGAEPSPEADSYSKAEPLSDANAVGGTPSYMAPEMAMGEVDKIGPASDVYLLGAILYEIVTGNRPHSGKGVMQCLYRAAKNEIVPTEETGGLVEIALTAMAGEPTERHPSVKAFQAALREYQACSESILLCSRARQDLAQAEEGKSYDDYAQALFGFREALKLWDANAEATQGILQTQLAYATCAYARNDFDLAASQLSAAEPSHADLVRRVRTAAGARAKRQSRLRMLRLVAAGLGVTVFLVVSVALLCVRAEQRKTAAERDRALQAEAEANAARDAEARQHAMTERENYCNLTLLAGRHIAEGAFALAEAGLRDTPLALRGWEWGWLMRLCHPEAIRLASDGEPLVAAAFSADGRRVLTGTESGNVKVWDLATARVLKTIKAHTAAVYLVAGSPDGRQIAVASGTDITVWETATGRRVQTLTAESNVASVVFSPDGKRILSGGYRRPSIVWDLQKGKELFRVRDIVAYAAAYSPDGTRMVTNILDRTARVWDARTGRQVAVLRGHARDVTAVAFSPNGKRVMTGCEDGTTKVWDVESGRELLSMGSGSTIVISVRFSPDGKRGVTLDRGGAEKTWDLTTGRRLGVVQRESGLSSPPSYSPQGKLAATASRGIVRIWESTGETGPAVLKGHIGPVLALAFSPNGKLLLTGGGDKTVKLWDTETCKQTLSFAGSDLGSGVGFGAFAFSPDGRRVVIVGDSKTGSIWDTESGKVLQTLEGHEDRILAAVFSQDGLRLLTASTDRTARTWDARTGREILVVKLPTEPFWSAAFSPDGGGLLTRGPDGVGRLWDLEHGRELAVLEGQPRSACRIAFSPDGRRAAFAQVIWDMEQGGELVRLGGHPAGVASAAFSTDGSRLLTGGMDGQVKVWHAANGRELLNLGTHSRCVWAVAFSPDGRLVAASGMDGNVRLWRGIERTTSSEQLRNEKLERWRRARQTSSK